MTGLLLKDFLNIKKQAKTLFIVIFFYGFLTFFIDNVTFFVWFITFLFATSILTSFSLDEASKWDEFAVSFPLKRNHFVYSKYIFSILFILIGNVCSLFILFLYSGVKRLPIRVTELTTIFFGTFLIGCLFISLVIPFIVKLGIEKTRILIFSIFLIPFFLILIISKTININSFITKQQIDEILHFITSNLPLISIILSISLLLISCFISCKLFSKKEF